VKKLRAFYSGCAVLMLVACSQSDSDQLDALLNQRSVALQEKNIVQYQALISDDYHFLGRSKQDVVEEMQGLFQTFDAIQMTTYNRYIHLKDGAYAECQQSYTLKVKADDQWRNLTRSEQLQLQKKEGVWKIVSGL